MRITEIVIDVSGGYKLTLPAYFTDSDSPGFQIVCRANGDLGMVRPPRSSAYSIVANGIAIGQR